MPRQQSHSTKRKDDNTYQELFGDSKRFIVSGATGPKFDNHKNIRTWENKVVNYVPREWAEIGSAVKCWHGTRKENIQYIASQSLLPGGGRYRKRRFVGSMFGQGIYIAPKAAKAWNFAGMDEEGRRYLLQGRVALGKTFAPDQVGDFKQWVQNTGHGSIIAKAGVKIKGVLSSSTTLNYAEYCVYNPIQVVIDFVYEYEIIDKEKSERMSFQNLQSFLSRGRTGPDPLKTIEKSKTHPCWKNEKLCKNAYDASGCLFKKKKSGITLNEFEFCQRYET